MNRASFLVDPTTGIRPAIITGMIQQDNSSSHLPNSPEQVRLGIGE